MLRCPKSDVEVIRGLKSRDKTVAIMGLDKGDEKGCLETVRELLSNSIE